MISNLIIVVGIAIGLSLDLYAKSVCDGALLAQIDKKKLFFESFLFGIWQLAALIIGYETAVWLDRFHITQSGYSVNTLVSMVIFLAIAFRMLKTAWKNESIVEKRQEAEFLEKVMIHLCVQIGFFTFLTGLGIGLLEIQSVLLLAMFILFTVAGVVIGLISGYHFGYRQKTKAYVAGAIFLTATVIFTGINYL